METKQRIPLTPSALPVFVVVDRVDNGRDVDARISENLESPEMFSP